MDGRVCWRDQTNETGTIGAIQSVSITQHRGGNILVQIPIKISLPLKGAETVGRVELEVDGCVVSLHSLPMTDTHH